MPFFDTSQNVALDGTILRAECKDEEGSYKPSEMHLNAVLGNFDGSFQWLGTHWSVFAEDWYLDGSILHAELRRYDCDWLHASVDLDERISNIGGKLTYEHGDGIFSRIGQVASGEGNVFGHSMAREGVYGLTDAYDWYELDEDEIKVRDTIYAFQADVKRAGVESIFADTPAYEYKPLSTADSIRLVKIAPPSGNHDVVHCSLEEFTLEDAPPFAALSYTWKNPFPSTPEMDRRYNQNVPISCDGKRMSVSQSLYEALQRLRQGNPEEPRFEPYDKTELIEKAEEGSFFDVERLLRDGADVHAVDCFRNTALHYAAENGHVMIVKALVYAGSDIDAVDIHGRTPLACAQEHGRGFWAQVEKFLLQQRDRKDVITREDSSLRGQVTGIGYYWMDAISMNQFDDQEKSIVVAMMGEIYKRAATVVVWLGPTHDPQHDPTAGQLQSVWTLEGVRTGRQIEDGVLERMLSLFDRPDPYAVPVEDSDFASIAVRDWINTFDGSAMFDEWLLGPPFYRRSWFSRAWILQEVFLAKHITVVCGRYIVPWDVLIFMSSFIERMKAFRSKRAQQKRIIGALLVTDRTERAPAIDLERRKRTFRSLGKLPMLNSLTLTRNARAKDSRDKVFSALSFSSMVQLTDSGLEPITPDYTQTTAELYINVGKTLLELHGPCALSLAGMHKSPGCTGLPSWTPDLQVPLRASPNGISIYDISNDPPEFRRTGTGSFLTDLFKITAKNELIVEGLVWDTISQMTPPGLNDVGSELEYLSTWVDLVSDLAMCPLEKQRALWRTLIEDQSATLLEPEVLNTPVPSDLNDSNFRDWLLFMCFTTIFDLRDFLRSCVQGFRMPETQDAITLAMYNARRVTSLLEKAQLLLATLDLPFAPNKSIPERLRDLLSEEMQREKMDVDSDVWQIWEFMAPYAEAFGNAIRAKDTSRRLMRLENANTIGTVPEMSQVGDKICLVRGAKVPYVLRYTGEGKYQLVGEAYVYGVNVQEQFTGATTGSPTTSNGQFSPTERAFNTLSIEDGWTDVTHHSVERICIV